VWYFAQVAPSGESLRSERGLVRLFGGSLFARAKPRCRLYLSCVSVLVYVALFCVSAVVMLYFVAVCLQFNKVDDDDDDDDDYYYYQ